MKPTHLRGGDTIALVSPASPITEDKLGFVTQLLNDAGYEVRTMPHALDRDGYLAGDDSSRAADLQEAFDDPNIAGILCTRGGYGCARTLPYLDLDRMAKSRKLFAGFSDITTLHLALNKRGMPTLHSPMALTLASPREPWVIESFLASLRGELQAPVSAPRGKCLADGRARGRSTGGCLCLVTDAMGTEDELEPDGKILFLEDVDEAPHRVDAMFTHLKNSGILLKISGLVIGEMTRTDEKADHEIGAKDWRTIVTERVQDLNVPVILDYPFGHAKNMLTVGLGVMVEMDAELGTVTYLEPICE